MAIEGQIYLQPKLTFAKLTCLCVRSRWAW